MLANREPVLFGELGNLITLNYSLDMISNIRHALFERYFTAGEVFHVSSIIMESSSAEMLAARDIATKNGWGNGFEKTVALISELVE